MPNASFEIFGIRHHGPGSARSLRGALDQLQPTHVVIEGPPELDEIAHFAADSAMTPPVAALVYAMDEPHRASFYPLAEFSPEWIALQWADRHGACVAFADLPAANELALDRRDERDPNTTDPIASLASVSGYDDPERWWEDAIEQRAATDALARFRAVTDAMAAMREGVDESPTLLAREAAMRRVLRSLASLGDARVAVVCGAYHAPVLVPDAWPAQRADAELLRNLSKVKVAATWVPWTTRRLTFASGYGAGVRSPGWYRHVFASDEDVIVRWMVKAATFLRAEQYHVSPASAVESSRLADALASVRGRPLAGLQEVTDAIRAVMCDGSDVALSLVHDQLTVGDDLGGVPEETPQVPIARDLAAQQKRLRLAASAQQKTIVLDLRQDNGLARSVLLHRLLLLGVRWGTLTDTGRTTGTFKEAWLLEWQPQLSIDLIMAGVYGTTVESAVAAKVAHDARATSDLPALAALVEACLLAELPTGLHEVLDELAARTAQQHDALLLLHAVEPLARTYRYGDVRGGDPAAVARVLDVLVTRAALGLGSAVASLDDDRADEARTAIEAAHRGVSLADIAPLREQWYRALSAVAEQPLVHGTVQGRVVRLLLDAGELPIEAVRAHVSRNLSRAADARHGAAWLDGFLVGDVALLLHDADLLSAIDDWVTNVADDTFEDVLPLLRRAFARYEKPERRLLGDRLKRGQTIDRTEIDLDSVRAAPAVAKVAALLGIDR